ncbi:L-fucose:H+ symporter permease [Marinimicrobium sp. ABcell2]|uniref:L-fucose:H+ symporter permease n=1 Tax=Marinimicrobium sp. ABcell2 TaxID=3069751 RepID=UPI0027B426D5|nr:L-fucose:H+ symporter permease [Marinimicrobium sp. ABcell2]MDQ2077216.1 L-fucose:H+ symporter permease [Marinimicrobium sp. ABcell2]
MSTHNKSTMLFPLMLIVSLFFLWGVANNLNDILIGHFRKAFSLTDFASGLVQSAFYMGYFCFAIPAALYMKRFGYKSGVILGLLLYGVGALLFYPAAEMHEYRFFLFALFVIASGLAFLETSANPLIVAMGNPDTAERRLNLAQSFNPLGVISGVVIGKLFILSGVEPTAAELAAMTATELDAFYTSEARAVQGPYLVLAGVVIFWAVMVWFTKFPQVATESAGVGKAKDYRQLVRNRYFMFGVITQFFYVGAQVCIWSYMIRYGQMALPGTGEKALADFLIWSLVAFMIGRFVATALMSKFRPAAIMLLFAGINVVLCAVAMASPNLTGMLALAATSFFMSLMFPTIFALSLRGLGEQSKAGASLLIMAIVGGAALTALMGGVSDITSINVAVVVPLVCFLVIAAFAKASLSRSKSVARANEVADAAPSAAVS